MATIGAKSVGIWVVLAAGAAGADLAVGTDFPLSERAVAARGARVFDPEVLYVSPSHVEAGALALVDGGWFEGHRFEGDPSESLWFETPAGGADRLWEALLLDVPAALWDLPALLGGAADGTGAAGLSGAEFRASESGGALLSAGLLIVTN